MFILKLQRAESVLTHMTYNGTYLFRGTAWL